MTLAVSLAVGFAAGAALGAAYFRALWLTVSTLDRSQRPAVRIAASLALRFALALAGFYLIARYGGWQPLVAAAVGFTVLRFLAVRRYGSEAGRAGEPRARREADA